MSAQNTQNELTKEQMQQNAQLQEEVMNDLALKVGAAERDSSINKAIATQKTREVEQWKKEYEKKVKELKHANSVINEMKKEKKNKEEDVVEGEVVE